MVDVKENGKRVIISAKEYVKRRIQTPISIDHLLVVFRKFILIYLLITDVLIRSQVIKKSNSFILKFNCKHCLFLV